MARFIMLTIATTTVLLGYVEHGIYILLVGIFTVGGGKRV